jgi:hypothetical protein
MLCQSHRARREDISTLTSKQEEVAAVVVVWSDQPDPRDTGLHQQRLDLKIVILEAPDQRGHLVGDRLAGTLLRADRGVLIITGNQLELVAVDPAGAVDLVDRDLRAELEALAPKATTPTTPTTPTIAIPSATRRCLIIPSSYLDPWEYRTLSSFGARIGHSSL